MVTLGKDKGIIASSFKGSNVYLQCHILSVPNNYVTCPVIRGCFSNLRQGYTVSKLGLYMNIA